MGHFGATDSLLPEEEVRRRSSRFPLMVPVVVKWRRLDGTCAQEEGQAKEVNAHGGLVLMKNYPLTGDELDLTNSISGETAKARALGIRRSREGAIQGMAVELVVPSDTFWGLTFRLKRTSAELLKLEAAIQSGGMDLRVLREFRDAVDHIRKTAWVVYEWQERHVQGREAETVLSLLTLEHIRRATQLSTDLATDLDTHEVTRETTGLAELFPAVERLYHLLVGVFGLAPAM